MLRITIVSFSFILIALVTACTKQEFERAEPPTTQLSSVTGRAIHPGIVLKGDDDDPIIQGRIMDSLDQPLPGATVKLFEYGIPQPVDSALSDSVGEVYFQVDTAVWYLTVFKEPYELVTTEEIEVVMDTTFSVNLE